MDIHAPHHPVLTFREALVHLAIVTVGILIALSLEGTRQWYEHRVQVSEARRNLLAEVRGNKDSLEKSFLAQVPASRKENEQIAAVVQSLMDHDSRSDLRWNSNYPLTRLQSASFATAQITGAFALMDYDEAARFSALYRLQEVFERQHEAGLTNQTNSFAIGTMVSASARKNHRNVNTADLSEWRRLVAQLDTALLIQSQIGTALDTAYGAILDQKPPGAAAR